MRWEQLRGQEVAAASGRSRCRRTSLHSRLQNDITEKEEKNSIKLAHKLTDKDVDVEKEEEEDTNKDTRTQEYKREQHQLISDEEGWHTRMYRSFAKQSKQENGFKPPFYKNQHQHIERESGWVSERDTYTNVHVTQAKKKNNVTKRWQRGRQKEREREKHLTIDLYISSARLRK